MLEEISVIDQINVLEQGHIQVRRADRIFKDGIEISKSYHRHVLAPNDSLDGEDERVVAIANAVWTAEVIEAYRLANLI